MTLMPDTEGKLIVLRIFFYIAGVCMLLQALVLRRIPCPPRKAEEKQEMGLKMFPEALNQMVRSKPFRGFFICIMLFYLSWHLDWSLWYIAETKYAGMNEAQLSFFQALCSICQMIFIGFFSKLCRRKSEHFTIIFVCAGLLLCPITDYDDPPLPHDEAPRRLVPPAV